MRTDEPDDGKFCLKNGWNQNQQGNELANMRSRERAAPTAITVADRAEKPMNSAKD